jgi:glycosyltransferase involved in cell wall biosynthesis
MRILYGTDHLFPSTDASCEQVVHTVSALGKRGISVELVIPRPRGTSPVTGDALRDYYAVDGPFEVSQVPAPVVGFQPLRKSLHAAGTMRRYAPGDFDLLYTRNIPTMRAALRRGFRVAYEAFRPWGDQYPVLRPLLRTWMSHPRFVGAILHSHFARDSYVRLGVAPERAVCIHNGFEPERMEPRLGTAEARARIGLDAAGPVAMYTGRLNHKKGLDALLAMARQCPDIVFVLVGSENPGGVIEREALGLPNVRVYPWQRTDALPTYVYAADVLVIPPSRAPLDRHGSTVLPLKLFLYLAAGRAILAPRAPDTAELLDHDVNAWLVPPGDVGEAAAALRTLAHDPALRTRLAEASRARAADLTWDARAAHIERFLKGRLAQMA